MSSVFTRHFVTFVTIFLFNAQAQSQDAPSRFKIWFKGNIEWENGKLSKAKIISKLGNSLKLTYKGKVILLENTKKGENYTFGENLSPND